MSDKSSILGFIPKDKYLTWTYMLLLVASAGGMALDVFGMIGINIPLGGVFGLAGLCGLILALLGLFCFQRRFRDIGAGALFIYLRIICPVLRHRGGGGRVTVHIPHAGHCHILRASGLRVVADLHRI